MNLDLIGKISAADLRQLRAYCLGECTPTEAESLAERCFTDDDFFAAYEDVKEQLILDYLHGRGSGVERAKFERSFGAHPERRLEVQLLAQLAQLPAAPRLSAAANSSNASLPVTQPVSWWASWQSNTRLWQLSAALLALICLGSLLWWGWQSRSQGTNLPTALIVQAPIASDDHLRHVAPANDAQRAAAGYIAPTPITLTRHTRTVTVRLLVDDTDLPLPYHCTIQPESDGVTPARILGESYLAELLPPSQAVVSITLDVAQFIRQPDTYRLKLTRGNTARMYRLAFRCADC